MIMSMDAIAPVLIMSSKYGWLTMLTMSKGDNHNVLMIICMALAISKFISFGGSVMNAFRRGTNSLLYRSSKSTTVGSRPQSRYIPAANC